jgi:mycothiol synthase
MRIHPVENDEHLSAWIAVRNEVVPEEPTSIEDMRRREREGRLLLLAELDGQVAACGLADRSDVAGLAAVIPRVLPQRRRQGAGTALLLALVAHAESIGLTELAAYVEGDDPDSQAFAARFGFHEVDRQVGQVRTIGAAEPAAPALPDGIEVATVAERPELLRAAYPLAAAAYAELPVMSPLDIGEDRWLAEEATLPAGSFVALHGGEVVGYAGLMELGGDGTSAEHGLTVVRTDWRGRGLATALKRRQIAYAAASGLDRLMTWTQRGNEDMQRLNRALGYRTEGETLNLRSTVAAVREAHARGRA